ncbi:MAG: L,D-transpeptidase [Actinomycetota bacterium]|nr:L,D-transpeptidase [Actinomycetota bacterium]
MLRLCSVFAVAVLAALAVAPAAPAGKRKRPAHVPALQIVPERVYAINGTRVALVHRKIRFRGRVRQYVPGQVFSVRVRVGKRRYVRATRTATPRGAGGEFVVEVKTHRVGRIRAVAGGGGLRARSRSVHVVRASAAYGQEGLHVQFLQRRLRDLRYLVGLSGRLGGSTQRAIMAYRKVSGLPRSFRASRAIFERLADGRGRFRSKFPNHGKHVEADLSRQVLVLHDRRGRVFRILHTASGTSATPTVRGSFRVYSKTWGVNSLGMVHSVYFHRGYAIHGYPSVPAGPASHGCLRIPIPNARFIYRWLDYGDRIDVYA